MRLDHEAHGNYMAFVSIHAPVKDATFRYKLGINRVKVSIHAPVKDATGCV